MVLNSKLTKQTVKKIGKNVLYEDHTKAVANGLNQVSSGKEPTAIEIEETTSGPPQTHAIKKKPTSMPSNSCIKTQQSTVVTMNGVAMAVISPDLLKSLRPLSGAEHRKAQNYDMEADYSMDGIQRQAVESKLGVK